MAVVLGLAATEVNAAPAVAAVLDLRDRCPSLTWVVGCVDDEGCWSAVALSGEDYAEALGVEIPFDDTLIGYADAGTVPPVVLDVRALGDRAEAPVTRDHTIGCHVSVTTHDPDGRPLVTLTGLGPEPRSADDLSRLLPVMHDLVGAVPHGD